MGTLAPKEVIERWIFEIQSVRVVVSLHKNKRDEVITHCDDLRFEIWESTHETGESISS